LIQSRATRRFWRLFRDLPPAAQRDAKRAYGVFQNNPAHPSLQFKKLQGEENIYSVRIGLNRVVWYWIGSHSEYDRLV
jgi:hypothetical protein